MPATIADIRRDYKLESLAESDVHPNAIDQFTRWWNEALKSKIDEVNAMTLATASRDGLPSARIVLLKGYDKNGFVFYTNYNSFKGQQLAENPRACLVFFWKELERQVRVTGLVEKISSAESDEYFNIRPEGSKLSAIVSPQSQVIPERSWLEKEVEQLMHHLSSNAIERPGY